MSSPTRILLAEDEVISRMDLREMLENLGYTVIGEAGDGVAAVNLARTLKPDLDIGAPRAAAIQANGSADRRRRSCWQRGH